MEVLLSAVSDLIDKHVRWRPLKYGLLTVVFVLICALFVVSLTGMFQRDTEAYLPPLVQDAKGGELLCLREPSEYSGVSACQRPATSLQEEWVPIVAP